MARELTISYGGVTMGGASAVYLLDGKYTTTFDALRKSVRWTVTVVNTPGADFASSCAALESAFQGRRGTLAISFDGNSHESSAMLAEPSAAKISSTATTGGSRVYECEVSWHLVADQGNRVWARIEVSEDESKVRTYKVTGQWTPSSSGGSARSNCETLLESFANSNRPSGTWDVGLVSITTDMDDKLADGTWVQREIAYGEVAASPANNADIIRHQLTLDKSQANPGDSPGVTARQRATITATWSCGVDHTSTTDLKALYEDTIRPFIFDEVKRVYGIDDFALVSENPRYLRAANRIDASLTMEAEVEPAGVFSYRVSQRVQVIPGRFLVPVWTGRPTDKIKYEGPSRAIRTSTIQAEGVGDHLMRLSPVAGYGELTDSSRSDTDPVFHDDVDESWVLLDYSENVTPLVLGSEELEHTIEMYQADWTIVEEFFTKPEAKEFSRGGGAAGELEDNSGGNEPITPITGGG